ncbi:autotransporter outer membrane beta-barrel domain-containing protein [Aliiroseovarius subalbicans]|uniref:autotransporter outer membrane beta-barrel domain-containing protein n=1 Tax=Aliiroseovarius subalbicans TaxID=2925840 RepID=UPI001F582CF9|nr:autotransporter outer membrane beta-barrel domain-containing protein [Aliiroseovarius subalbicans]MCI2398596.1 autotransporter outer membrane beta-barrel domain-containing protein [Aliiroseovarius subalbicans]
MKTGAITPIANPGHAPRVLGHVALRGGRMAKVAGRAVSYAPSLGCQLTGSFQNTARALALGFAIATPFSGVGPGIAGTCAPAGSGDWLCAGLPGADLGANLYAHTGAMSVTTAPGFGLMTTDPVALQIDGADGVSAVTINDEHAAPIRGARDGLVVTSYGWNSAVTLRTSGDIFGGTAGLFTSGTGVTVQSIYDGPVEVDTYGNVAGTGSGIVVQKGWPGPPLAGSVAITSHASAWGYGRGQGIYAYGHGGDITLTALGRTGSDLGDGIYGAQMGYGGLAIATGAGPVVGGGRIGINAHTGAYAQGDLTVSTGTGAISGQSFGMNLSNRGAGGLSLTTGGAVTAASGTAIHADNNGPGGVSITTTTGQPVPGQIHGITALNVGGAAQIMANGSVTGSTGQGITLTNGAGATTATIQASDVLAGQDGVALIQSGSGAAHVTTTGTVWGTAGTGISLTHLSGGEVSVTALSTVTGGIDGIALSHLGSGTARVSFGGDVIGGEDGVVVRAPAGADIALQGSGDIRADTGSGVLALAQGGAGDIAITLGRGTISARDIGLKAVNTGSGRTAVTLEGGITGQVGIDLQAQTGGLSQLDLRDGAHLHGSTTALSTGDGASQVTVAAGAYVDGAIRLGGGNDSLHFAGSDISGVTLFDGGDGNDFLHFDNTADTVAALDLIGWDRIALGGATRLGIGPGALEAGRVELSSAAILDLGFGDVTLRGDLHSDGAVTAQNGVTGDQIEINGDLSGTGTLFIDADFASDQADQIRIGGDVQGRFLLGVADTAQLPATGGDIVVIEVAGATDEDDFTLLGGPIQSGVFSYDLEREGAKWLLANRFSVTASSYEATPAMLLSFTNLPDRATRQASQIWSSVDGARGAWLQMSSGWQATTLATRSGAEMIRRRSFGLHAGYDLIAQGGSAGHWELGAMAHWGMSTARIGGATGQGQIDTTGYGLGTRASWQSFGGIFLDLQGQISWLSTDITSSTGGQLVEAHKSTAVALSAELGHRFILAGGGALIPQAALNWSRTNAGAIEADAMGNSVTLGQSQALTGRLGVDWQLAASLPVLNGVDLRLTGNLLHDFAGATEVEVAGTSLSASGPDTWAEFGLSSQATLPSGAALFATGRYRTPLTDGGSGKFGLEASVGLNLSW